MEKLIVIGGATASGKSRLAVQIAKGLNTEIISADSMQIFKHMNIGTAKVTDEEMQGIPHHMIDIVEPYESFSVAEYVNRAREIISDINSSGRIPVVVGGTGLYIDALLYDFEFNNADSNPMLRHELEEMSQKYGNEYVHDLLKEIDPQEADKIHYNNVKRVIRAIEIYKTTGRTKSENKKTLKYDVNMYIINTDRQILYQRINDRVDKMIDEGLVGEVSGLLKSGITFDMQSMQGIGYKEWKGYFEGESDLNTVIDTIKQSSRNYAKRQMTWFNNKYKDICKFVSADRSDEIINDIN